MTSSFSAGPQALGYLYQVRYALYAILSARQDDIDVAIESLDDVDVANAKGPISLSQLKHHIVRTASLSDTSTDLWKTIRVWASGLSEKKWDPDLVRLQLLTTATAPANSAAALLKPSDGRDAKRAVDLLLAAAGASKSKDNALQSSFAAFQSLQHADQIRMLSAVYIFDAAPTVIDLEVKIREEILYASPPEKALRDRLYHELEGWWFAIAVKHLMDGSRNRIPALHVFRKIWSITEDLQPARLPIDFAAAEPSGEVDPVRDPRTFVLQLRILDLQAERVRRAMLDYYRAFEQRSSWAKLHLIADDALSNYERRLIDEWMGFKLHLEGETTEPLGDEELIGLGRRLLGWMETEANIPIRPEVLDKFVMRGSFHMLANESTPRVHWHPKFLERLDDLLR